ncbi:arginine--tRNA ligase, chloroplastic/mitochondrial-like protein isoform X2, partial [Tanacetum coccineum]
MAEMRVDQLRSTIIGDMLARMLEFSKVDVLRRNNYWTCDDRRVSIVVSGITSACDMDRVDEAKHHKEDGELEYKFLKSDCDMDGSIVRQHLVEHRGPIVRMKTSMDKRPGPVMNMEDLSKALQEAIIHIDIIHVDDAANEKKKKRVVTQEKQGKEKDGLTKYLLNDSIADQKPTTLTEHAQSEAKLGSRRCKFLEGVCIESTAMTAFKKDVVKQEVEPNEDMIRSALRAISSL